MCTFLQSHAQICDRTFQKPEKRTPCKLAPHEVVSANHGDIFIYDLQKVFCSRSPSGDAYLITHLGDHWRLWSHSSPMRMHVPKGNVCALICLIHLRGLVHRSYMLKPYHWLFSYFVVHGFGVQWYANRQSIHNHDEPALPYFTQRHLRWCPLLSCGGALTIDLSDIRRP